METSKRMSERSCYETVQYVNLWYALAAKMQIR
jgi:hypothetical protein